MRRSTALLSIALAAVPLAGCATDEYGYGYGYHDGYYGDSYGRGDYGGRYAYGSPYDVWYDGYYGPIDDGYWGGDGYFWYTSGRNRDWRRGEGAHFRRQAHNGWRHYRFDDRARGRGDERDWGRRQRNGDDRDHRDGYRRGYR